MTQAKSFLKEIDFTKQELEELIDLSIKFKQLKKERIPHKYLDGLNIALIFEKHLQELAQLYSGWSGPRYECDLPWCWRHSVR